MNYQKGDFTKYVDFVRNECDMGRCTKEEAINAIIKRMSKILSEIPKVQNMRTYDQQFMQDRTLEALNIN
jgi:hypothetical protein